MLQKHYSKASEENGKQYADAAAANYPYTYARICVMRAALIKKGDYAKLLKMSPGEIINFLESTEYKREIDELAMSHKGSNLVEIALNRNLSNMHQKFRKISPEKLRALTDSYLKRHDIASIKTILRAKYSGEKEVTALLQPCMLSSDTLEKLIKKDTIEEVLKGIKIVEPAILKRAYEKFKETNTLVEIENSIDQAYYDEAMNAISKIHGTMFKNFLEEEIDIKNTLNILRFKREGLDKKEIWNFMIKSRSGKKANGRIKKLADSTLNEIPSLLESVGYGTIAKKGLEEYKKSGTLIYIETDLYRHLLKNALLMLHYRPLKADAIFGYMFAKEIEVRNLKMLIKAKQLGLPQEFIEEQIIM